MSEDAAELERLRARVEQLENELVEQAARSQALVAAAQEQTYWLDRWGVDLNALMRRPAVMRVYRVLAAARRLKRRLG